MAKTVEIEEADLLAKDRVVNLYSQMLANPKARELLETAVKTVNPQIATPITDAKSEVLSELGKEREARLALEKRLDDEKADREAEKARQQFANTWERQKARVRAERGYTDEGIAEIEKLCEERGIPDFEAGALLFDKLHPPPAVEAPAGFGSWNLFEPASHDGEDFKKLMDSKGEDEMALRRLVDGTLTEVRGGVRR